MKKIIRLSQEKVREGMPQKKAKKNHKNMWFPTIHRREPLFCERLECMAFLLEDPKDTPFLLKVALCRICWGLVT